MHNAITDVLGIEVGHYTDLSAATGCTVVLCRDGAVAGVDVRGSAPGTRETDLLRPMNLVQQVHAVVLTGGSAYGLDVASGVMRWLEEHGIGFSVGVGVVPIVPAAVLFDLTIGRADIRPNADAGYAACQVAGGGPVTEGSIGAGTGATVGKLFGPAFAVKGGLGTAARRVANGITVGALVAVNAFGDIVDPATGALIAGPRDPSHGGMVCTLERLEGDLSQTMFGFALNTTLAVVATDALLTKEGVNKMAQMAQDGLAQAIRPAHTMWDGDTVFALATGKSGVAGDVTVLGAVAATTLAEAIVRAVRKATTLGGIPAIDDLATRQCA
ncbi:MAG: P1 family peptidase [Anaerolineae bacterium]|nr:P1 family peptidase [Anaerolineae bacterium]